MTRDEAIETLEEMIKLGDLYEVDIDACEIAVKALKQKPKTGHWIKRPHGFKCSKCLIVHSHTSIFCPSCGAKMIEPQESEAKCKTCKYYSNPDYTRCHECNAESEESEEQA